jgi:hypothetical protein
MDKNSLEEYQQLHVRVPQRHIDFLDSINTERSTALRTVLDSIMRGTEQVQRKKILDNSILYVCFGFFFFILTSLITKTIPYFICLLLGTFLVAYGGIGGGQLVLSRKR